jgi:CHAT domain-containing protein
MPNEDAVKDISILAANLNELKRGEGAPRFCLYVGTGASRLSNGSSIAEELRKRVLCGNFGANLSIEEWNALSESEYDVEEKFSATWGRLAQQLREKLVNEVTSEAFVTEGHRALATIIATGYFPLIITSNTDILIEDALVKMEVPRSRWRTIINDSGRPENIRDALLMPRSEITILKLCGDTFNSLIYSVNLREIDNTVRPLINVLGPYLAHPMVFTGYSFLDDNIIKSFPPRRDTTYYIGTHLPPGDWTFYQRFPYESRVDIIDEDLDFDGFCNVFAQRLTVFQNVEEYGRPVTAAVVERVRGDAEESELLVELIDDEQMQTHVEQEQTQAGVEEPLVEMIQNTIFSVRFDEQQQLSFEVKGKFSYESASAQRWQIDVDEFNSVLSDMGRDIAAYHRLRDQEGRDTWRRRAKREGQMLYNNLMQTNADLSRKFEVARRITKYPEILNLYCIGPRQHLSIPYELLHDGQVPLAVQYPLSRQVSGVVSHQSKTFSSLMAALRHENKPLRVLLIASDTGQLSVDTEVRDLQQLIEARVQGHFKLQIDCLTTQEASLDEVEKLLEHCSYHIAHFAGHAQFDSKNVENSGLLLFKGKGRAGGITLLTARRLARLLNESQNMFFYLSCCIGAATGGSQHLRSNDYLGLMDAVVQAGVPYVVGYRWYVTDSGSRRFAVNFYEQLLTDPYSPEKSMLYARQQIYGKSGNDETWTSPILVAQNNDS